MRTTVARPQLADSSRLPAPHVAFATSSTPLADVDAAWSRRMDQLAWALVGLGIFLRVARYLLNFPFWGDELMLIQNYLDRDFRDLARPLTLEQVAPLGYQAIELAAIKLFGFSEWSLRLVAVVSGVASMLLFRDVAARTLGRVPMVLAVGVLAVAYYPIRHAAECKPYGSDLAASLLLVWLAVRWHEHPEQRRWLWALAAAGPVMVALSNPTIFVAGGISIALCWSAWKSRDYRTWLAFILYSALTVGTFVALLWLVNASQYETTHKFMLNYWAGGFPPWQPLALMSWLASIHAGEMMAYPVGDDRFGSILSLSCFVAGLVVLKRRRQHVLLTLVIAPLALALVAAALRRYPYGGARLSQYYGALACLMIGLGGAALLDLIARAEVRRRAFQVAIGVLLVIGGATLAKDMAQPYKRVVDFEHRGFARWFWKEQAGEGELICLHTDLGLNFYNERTSEDYSCYQRTYSPLHRRGARGVQLAELPVQRPLRCTMFWLEGERRNETAYQAWLAQMTADYELTGEQSFRVQLNAPREPSRFGHYAVYEFRHRLAAQTASAER